MPISHKHKCIFVHIPKTAGTSLSDALFSGERQLSTPDGEGGVVLDKHATARQIRDAVGLEMWKEYFTFTFVRNPWDLMLSCYGWWCQIAPQLPDVQDQALEVLGMSSFASFLQSEYGKQRIAQYRGECVDWFMDDAGEIMVDFVGRFETLGEDLQRICSELEVETPALRHRKRSKHGHYSAYYNCDLRQLVAERFDKEIELFGYEFDDCSQSEFRTGADVATVSPSLRAKIEWVRSKRFLRDRFPVAYSVMKRLVGRHHTS